MSRAAAGDPAAIEALGVRLACIPAFVRVFNRRRGGPLPAGDLEDVAQSALAAIWSKLDRYNGSSAVEAWAFGFCVREVLSAVRKRRRTGPVPAQDGGPAAAAHTPEESVGELEAVQLAVLELGSPAAEIVRLKHYEDATFPGIAQELGMPLGSVKTQYYRAVGRLRVRLAPLWRELQ